MDTIWHKNVAVHFILLSVMPEKKLVYKINGYSTIVK